MPELDVRLEVDDHLGEVIRKQESGEDKDAAIARLSLTSGTMRPGQTPP